MVSVAVASRRGSSTGNYSSSGSSRSSGMVVEHRKAFDEKPGSLFEHEKWFRTSLGNLVLLFFSFWGAFGGWF